MPPRPELPQHQHPQQPSRPYSSESFSLPTPELTLALPGISTASPGPNAFAIQQARHERHRLDGNAFYQQELQRRGFTPPVDRHPALRSVRSASSPLTSTYSPSFGSNSPSFAPSPYSDDSRHVGNIARPRILPNMADPPTNRDSQITTMSPFINAGRTPPLKLVPSPEKLHASEPTGRGFLEERGEFRAHIKSGSCEERTPVYTYTPKQPGTEFGQATPLAAKNKHNASVITEGDSSQSMASTPRSPKKSVLDFFRKSTRGNSSSSLVSSGTKSTYKENDAQVSPKAQAVLGTTPSKTDMVRSPSKRKGFFNGLRKHTGLGELNMSKISDLTRGNSVSALKSPAESITPTPTPTPAATNVTVGSIQGRTSTAAESTLSRTPKTALTTYSDPSYADYEEQKRITSKALSDETTLKFSTPMAKSLVARSQSLKYIDHVPPPTPPSKDTPPEVRNSHTQSSTGADYSSGPCNRMAQQQHDETSTPSKPPPKPSTKSSTATATTEATTAPLAGLISASGRLSPTKNGGYAHKDTPRLVTKPSVYSMHASVVPAAHDVAAFEEVKGRIDGLGLEGFSLPTENCYAQPSLSPEYVGAETFYSPSIYQQEWDGGVRPGSLMRLSRCAGRHSVDLLPLALNSTASVWEEKREEEVFGGKGYHQATESSSTTGSIPVLFNPSEIQYHIPSFRGGVQHGDSTTAATTTHQIPSTWNAQNDSTTTIHATATDGKIYDPAPLTAKDAHAHLGLPTSPTPKSSHGTLFAIPISSIARVEDILTDNHSHLPDHRTHPPTTHTRHQDNLSRPPPSPLSPISYSSPSAVPSPLHILPATTYTPPPATQRAVRRRAGSPELGSPSQAQAQGISRSHSPQRTIGGERACGSGSAKGNIVDSAPVLPVPGTQRASPAKAKASNAQIVEDETPIKRRAVPKQNHSQRAVATAARSLLVKQGQEIQQVQEVQQQIRQVRQILSAQQGPQQNQQAQTSQQVQPTLQVQQPQQTLTPELLERLSHLTPEQLYQLEQCQQAMKQVDRIRQNMSPQQLEQLALEPHIQAAQEPPKDWPRGAVSSEPESISDVAYEGGRFGFPHDKLDQMLNLLGTINTRHEEMVSMREEIRVANERLEKRLVAVEREHGSLLDEDEDGSESEARNGHIGREKAIEAAIAHLGTRRATSGSNLSTSDQVSDQASPADLAFEGESGNVRPLDETDTVARLEQSNRELKEVIRGFAKEMGEMRERLDQKRI